MSDIDIENVNLVLNKVVGHFQQQENEMFTQGIDDDEYLDDTADGEDLDEV